MELHPCSFRAPTAHWGPTPYPLHSKYALSPFTLGHPSLSFHLATPPHTSGPSLSNSSLPRWTCAPLGFPALGPLTFKHLLLCPGKWLVTPWKVASHLCIPTQSMVRASRQPSKLVHEIIVVACWNPAIIIIHERKEEWGVVRVMFSSPPLPLSFSGKGWPGFLIWWKGE